ncbi:MAG: hypothetical protein HKN49_01950 [Gammaproteobacteria bacterium]|nr:hypothetical protein [Gammaproteobacteria bacterium]
MTTEQSIATRLAAGDREAIRLTCRGPLRLRHDNLVERPWGGLRMLDYKGCYPLPAQKQLTGLGLGEAFETAACDRDGESAAFPSTVVLADGSEIALPRLVELAADSILGQDLVTRHGRHIPLLPKTLDIEELLSVQAHPPGNTELYVILDADPGASIRLGFREQIDPVQLRQRLHRGRARQRDLLGLLADDVDQHALHATLAPLLAQRTIKPSEAGEALSGWLRSGQSGRELETVFGQLHATYWYVLDLMNEVVVRPGQVLFNANPERIMSASQNPRSAEVHALGNPGQKEILMLEIRRPGVTYRAWDNVRFPVREIDIDKTLDALNLEPTEAEEFFVEPRLLAPGVERLADSEHFIVDRLCPDDSAVVLDDDRFATMHAIAGACRLQSDSADEALPCGHTAVIPASARGLRLTGAGTVIRVQLPR